MQALDILAIGEAMVAFNQVKGGDGRSSLLGFGGDTSNAMIAAARQGVRCIGRPITSNQGAVAPLPNPVQVRYLIDTSP
jgi:hypothetical protein